eukprot:2057213-Alexandrium_andersonii.AAC.1
MGESATTERLGAPLRDPSCCIQNHIGSEDGACLGAPLRSAPVSLCGGDPPLHTGRLSHSGAAGAPTRA